MLQKSFRVVRLKFAQHVPDSGQKHLADSDGCLFVTPVGFDPVIPLSKFRLLFGFDQGIGELDKKRLQITAGAGDPPGFQKRGFCIVGRQKERHQRVRRDVPRYSW